MKLNKFRPKAFLLDTTLSILVYVPLTAAWNLSFNQVSLSALCLLLIGSAVVNAVSGGFYGKLLDFWRRKWGY